MRTCSISLLSSAIAVVATVTARPIVLASLVRAGVPLGVLLRRALVEMGCETSHYGISIVRGRRADL